MLVYFNYVFNFTLANHNKAISRRFLSPASVGLFCTPKHGKDYSVVKTFKAAPALPGSSFLRQY